MDLRKHVEIGVVALLAFGVGASAESSLTIYNQNFAVVRESVPLDLQRGTNEVSVTQITAHLEPDSVILRDPQGKRALQILEQNYRADPISQGLLLSLYEGQEIDFLVPRGEGKEEIVRGKTFENARIKLMAGDVSKIQPVAYATAGYEFATGLAGAMRAPVSEKAFEEYHLYTLSRPTTLHDRETKQVEFLRAEGVQAQRLYVYDGAKIDRNRYRGYSSDSIRQDRDYGTQSNPKVWVMKEFKNSEENHLGIPLPKGRMRFYQRDDDGRLEFISENTIDHTPRDETVRVYTGDAFDLVGERRRTDYQIDTARNGLDEAFEIKLRNRKDSGSVEIRVVEHLYRWINWQITEKSDPFTKTDSQTVEFRVQVPAGQEKVAMYKVHYTW